MSIVIYTNKKTGIRYAYENESYWVPELKQARNRRKYLGRVDDDGNIIPSTGKRGRPAGSAADRSGYKDKYLAASEAVRKKDKEIAELKKENKKLKSVIDEIQKLINR